MDRLYKLIATNYFELSYGCYEFTMKGNIHAHFLVKLREHVELQTYQASVKMMNAHLKRYSICDFQLIKDHDNVIKYIYKDKFETKSILVIKDPCRSYLPKPEEYKNPLSKRMEYYDSTKIYAKYFDEIYERDLNEAVECGIPE
jgi:hypothetical protein